MRTRAPYGRKMTTLPLPGESESVLSWLISQAVKRDSRLNREELGTVLCTRQQIVYGLDFCLLDVCPYCGGYGARTTEYEDPNGRYRDWA